MNDYPASQKMTPEQSVPESEPTFENTHIRDKQFFKEFYKRSLLSPSHIVIYIFLGLSFLSNVCTYIFAHVVFWSILIAPICFFVFIATYFINVRIMNNRQQELSADQPIVYTTQFVEDRMIVQNSLGTKHDLPLSIVSKCIFTKHYILLATKAKQSFPIKKDGFTKGTYEDFCSFLSSKGYKVKK